MAPSTALARVSMAIITDRAQYDLKKVEAYKTSVLIIELPNICILQNVFTTRGFCGIPGSAIQAKSFFHPHQCVADITSIGGFRGRAVYCDVD